MNNGVSIFDVSDDTKAKGKSPISSFFVVVQVDIFMSSNQRRQEKDRIVKNSQLLFNYNTESSAGSRAIYNRINVVLYAASTTKI